MTAGRLAIALSGAAVVTLLTGLVAGLLMRPVAPAVPALPPVGIEDLLSSIQRAAPVALAGTVHWESDAAVASFAAPNQTARLWSDASGRWRISLPQPDGERAIIDDGATTWLWNSATRSLIRTPRQPASPVLPSLVPPPDAPTSAADQVDPLDEAQRRELVANPIAMAGAMIALVQPESTARLDPAVTVANRPAYQLVLNPLPTERTLLREIRVAVDSQTRLPLEVSVLANGSAQPALRVAFTQITFGPQDPALFTFAPVAGVSVRRVASTSQVSTSLPSTSAELEDGRTPLVRATVASRPGAPSTTERGSVIGRGWDTVLVRRLSAAQAEACRSAALHRRAMGQGVSGPWGRDQLVSTPIGNALVTADGRWASGAVPAQVLSEALGR